MAFNSRKFQKLMEDEQKNNGAFVDEFEDDFADDFDDEPAEDSAPDAVDFVPEADEVTEFEPVIEEEPVEEEPEEAPEEAPAEEPEEAPAEEEIEEEPAAECEEEQVIAILPVEDEKEEEYDPHKMWQDMAALAINAKQCITAGAFFRANDIVTAMRSMLVEMMCRANGITDNFNENADNLSEECKQDIYTSYTSVLNAKELSDTVTHIMTVTYKYI